MFTPQILYQTLLNQAVPLRLWVAYSGGLDSHVLLHALVKLRTELMNAISGCHPFGDPFKSVHARFVPQINLQAVHINHGLSPHAKAWAEHCQHVCDKLDVPLTIHHIDSKSYSDKSSIEATARHYRYQIFADILPRQECLLTAHHRDDQTETVLFRLLRGGGPKGLSAMAYLRPLGKGMLLRPLLDISRADLEAYAQAEKLVWIEDESNLCTNIDRNYLRHSVLPILTARWPSVARSLSRTADHCREATFLLEEMASEDMKNAKGSVEHTLSLSALKTFSFPRQKNIVRFWLKNCRFSLPSTKKLHQLLRDCLGAKKDVMPLLRWEGVEVRCFNDNLYVSSPLLPHDPNKVIFWDTQAPILLENIGRIHCTFNYQISEGIRITIRFRQGGEIFHPSGRIGSHPLKKLFQEWRVPSWLRDRIPLIYFDNELVVVVGYAVAEKYKVLAGWIELSN